MNVHIIIVAAGSGSRFGSPLPKQFCELSGRPVLMHTVDAFRRALPSGKISVVLSNNMLGFWDELCLTHQFTSPAVVCGGATRHASVKNAIASISDWDDADIVLVHDGARPIVQADLINRVISRLTEGDAAGVVPAVAVSDSLRRLTAGGTQAVPREGFYAVQTPQAFRLGTLRQAYAIPYSSTMTDDASVVEAANLGCIAIAEGSPANIKITHPGDIAIAELHLRGTINPNAQPNHLE